MIVDTSVLVDIDRGNNLERLDRIDSNWYGISTATLMELSTGRYRRDIPENRFERLEENLEIIPVTTEIADIAGRIMADLLDRGDMIGINDIYIAATALKQKQPLLTADTSDFQKVKDLEIIDWNQV